MPIEDTNPGEIQFRVPGPSAGNRENETHRCRFQPNRRQDRPVSSLMTDTLFHPDEEAASALSSLDLRAHSSNVCSLQTDVPRRTSSS